MKQIQKTNCEFDLPSQLIELFTEQIRDLNVVPDIAIKAIAIADQHDADFGVFIDLVARDVQLTSHMLRMSNSPLFGLQHKVSNLEQAAKVLGFRQCKNLILTTCISSLMKKMPLQEEWIREMLGSHSLNTAILARQISQRYHLDFEGEEFTAGIIHDIGRTFFATLLPAKFAEIDTLDFVEGPELLDREKEIAGANHAELGAYFAATHNFPAQLVDAVRYHHTPRQSKDNKTLVALVSAADHIANYIQTNILPNAYMPDDNDGFRVLDEIGYPGIFDDFLDSAVEIIKDFNAHRTETSLVLST